MPELTFDDYTRHGWQLCKITEGSKRPTYRKWNTRERAITDADTASRLSGAGLLHAFSGTCALDVDDFDAARAWFAAHSVDLDALFDDPYAVQIVSGQKNRGKLLYSLRDPLPSKQIKNAEGAVVFEFRCGASSGNSAQDVLPPTIHPNKQPYRWRYDDLVTSWQTPPDFPAELLALWRAMLAPAEMTAPISAPRAEFPELQRVLTEYDPSIGYDDWIEIGMVLHHESSGAAFELWDAWSAKSSKYPGTEQLAQHWRSFGNSKTPKTIATLRQKSSASPDEFADLTIQSPSVTEIDPWAAAKADQLAKWRYIAAADWIDRPLPRWLIQDLLPDAELAMICGESGVGKSFLALELALAMVRGLPWRDKRVEQGPVAWIAAEAAGSMGPRLRAYIQAHHLKPHDVGTLHVLEASGIDLSNVEACEGLAQATAALQPVATFIDTLAAASGGANENSGEDMGRVLATCRQIHRATGRPVILIHHLGKDATKGARGWSGIRAAVHAELTVTRGNGDARVVTVTKMRDGPDAEQFVFALASLDVGTNPDGTSIKSAYVVAGEMPALEAGMPRTAVPKSPLRIYERTMYDMLLGLADGADGERVEVLPVEKAIVMAVAKMVKPVGERDRRHRKAGDALQSLATKGYVQIEDGLVRVTYL